LNIIRRIHGDYRDKLQETREFTETALRAQRRVGKRLSDAGLSRGGLPPKAATNNQSNGAMSLSREKPRGSSASVRFLTPWMLRQVGRNARTGFGGVETEEQKRAFSLSRRQPLRQDIDRCKESPGIFSSPDGSIFFCLHFRVTYPRGFMGEITSGRAVVLVVDDDESIRTPSLTSTCPDSTALISLPVLSPSDQASKYS